ncbi:hypothetical protein RFN28_32590 [Mesorhizobium sp. VK24D]|uniref:DNA-binding protein n=1 Tax=Mesorhizobium album TaxID=3072314 RepID=A0ABU4YAM3_9HYPH|nr:hypothetical protein [Mesorhizobium sp. VK24D]MDX8483155.1 hypothetical protein [Mesorhizobium sp. VK24D]
MPRYFKTDEAARYLEETHNIRWAKSTLETMRTRGGGPAFFRFGAREIVYSDETLDAWVAAMLSAPAFSTTELSRSNEAA